MIETLKICLQCRFWKSIRRLGLEGYIAKRVRVTLQHHLALYSCQKPKVKNSCEVFITPDNDPRMKVLIALATEDCNLSFAGLIAPACLPMQILTTLHLSRQPGLFSTCYQTSKDQKTSLICQKPELICFFLFIMGFLLWKCLDHLCIYPYFIKLTMGGYMLKLIFNSI